MAAILQSCRSDINQVLAASDGKSHNVGKKGSPKKQDAFKKFSEATKEIVEWILFNLEKHITKSDYTK